MTETSAATKGNNPEAWNKLLAVLDDKLQLGLLDHLTKVAAYHIEDDTLYLEPASEEEASYLRRDSVMQQLQLLAQDAIKIDRVKIKSSIEKP
jgi:hypothetical protein